MSNEGINAAQEAAKQKPAGFMAELDEWTQNTLIAPLHDAWQEVENAPDEPYMQKAQHALLAVVLAVKKAVREKVLESYRNGQKAGPREAKPRR
jgi:hypothetical protein